MLSAHFPESLPILASLAAQALGKHRHRSVFKNRVHMTLSATFNLLWLWGLSETERLRASKPTTWTAATEISGTLSTDNTGNDKDNSSIICRKPILKMCKFPELSASSINRWHCLSYRPLCDRKGLEFRNPFMKLECQGKGSNFIMTN